MTTITGQSEGHPWASYAQEMPVASDLNTLIDQMIWWPTLKRGESLWFSLARVMIGASRVLSSLRYEMDESRLVNEIQLGTWHKVDFVTGPFSLLYLFTPWFGYSLLPPPVFAPPIGQWLAAVTEGERIVTQLPVCPFYGRL